MAHAIWSKKYARAHFSQRKRLFVDGDAKAKGEQCIRGKQPTNASAHDRNIERLFYDLRPHVAVWRAASARINRPPAQASSQAGEMKSRGLAIRERLFHSMF